MPQPVNLSACAVREYTADAKPAGRCWFHLEGNRCPRHGDVSKVQENYRATGRLTDEIDLPNWKRNK
jgi:hypothetical protein